MLHRSISHFGSLAIALSVMAFALPARAQIDPNLAGNYRVSSDQTTVQIPEWGSDCGPRPASHTGASGRLADVAISGSQLVVTDGRRHNRTDGCWSDNPEVHRISASGASPRWTVICQTPDANYQHEQGTYTISADATHVTMRESTDYSWQLRESRCRASASRTLVYERVGPPAQSTEPVAVHDAGPAHTAPPPPVNRCANVGVAASLQITPSRRSLAQGGRVCFRARVLDANRCELTAANAGPIAWTMARASGAATDGDATMENGCVRAPDGTPPAQYALTATRGSLSDRAIAAVVSEEELRSLVASHIEDEDAGVDSVPSGTVSGTGVGASVVHEPLAPPAPANGWMVWLLVGFGALLGLGGIALLVSRRGSAPVARSSVPNDPQWEQANGEQPPRMMPGQELAAAPLPAAVATPTLARPLTKRCPQCDQRFTNEIAFCPEHGTALVDVVASAAPTDPVQPTVPKSIASGSICSKCGEVVPDGATMCPRDGTPIQSTALPLRCPVCEKRFATGTLFCGEDGSALVSS